MIDEVARMRNIHDLIKTIKTESLRRRYITQFWDAFREMDGKEYGYVRRSVISPDAREEM